MRLVQSAVYLLCFLTSFIAMVLVYRSYMQNRTRLLLWSALAFVALAVNNLLLFVDIVVLPDVDLLPLRHLSALTAVGLLLYGFVWEID
jgi:hydrogenase/urease accessory protein HupE